LINILGQTLVASNFPRYEVISLGFNPEGTLKFTLNSVKTNIEYNSCSRLVYFLKADTLNSWERLTFLHTTFEDDRICNLKLHLPLENMKRKYYKPLSYLIFKVFQALGVTEGTLVLRKDPEWLISPIEDLRRWSWRTYLPEDDETNLIPKLVDALERLDISSKEITYAFDTFKVQVDRNLNPRPSYTFHIKTPNAWEKLTNLAETFTDE
jgi:hypothetical protein